jgi:hypothetical protein
LAKVKRTKEEMYITPEIRKKATTDFPRSALKRNNKFEEGGVSSSRVKREHESTNARAQKMTRGRVESFVVTTFVHVSKHTIEHHI